MANPKDSQRARSVVIRYLIAAWISAELKRLDKEGNFSPHTVHAFLLTLGRIAALLVEKHAMEPYKARHTAQRFMLTCLREHLPYPIPHFEEWMHETILLSPLRPLPLWYTLESIKPTCFYYIHSVNDAVNIQDAWEDITNEVGKITSTWLMKEEPYGLNEENVKALLCLFISRFYGLIVGKRYERRESVRYFLEREILDYLTEEGLEINYVFDQRKHKKIEKA